MTRDFPASGPGKRRWDELADSLVSTAEDRISPALERTSA
jgi:hypothetical protein